MVSESSSRQHLSQSVSPSVASLNLTQQSLQPSASVATVVSPVCSNDSAAAVAAACHQLSSNAPLGTTHTGGAIYQLATVSQADQLIQFSAQQLHQTVAAGQTLHQHPQSLGVVQSHQGHLQLPSQLLLPAGALSSLNPLQAVQLPAHSVSSLQLPVLASAPNTHPHLAHPTQSHLNPLTSALPTHVLQPTMANIAQQQFCLKWNNYQSNMSEVFQNMLLNENLCDVTLACEGASVKAHKMVLAACSPYFQSLFMANPCKHPIIILKDVRFVDLKSIIDFMYRGEVNVSQDKLSALLKTAEMLKVKGLAEVTDKQARGQPQLQQALFGAKPKKRKRNKGKGGKDASNEGSGESDEESGNKMRNTIGSPQRMGGVQKGNVTGTSGLVVPGGPLGQTIDVKDHHAHHAGAAGGGAPLQPEQIEPSRILEQSMATAEVGVTENGTESVMVPQEVASITDEEAFQQVALLDDSLQFGQAQVGMMTLPGSSLTDPGTQTASVDFNASSSARRLMMSEQQKRQLKDFLNKPIAYFDVVIDDWKKSIVWKYFGELAYKDPETGTVNIIDNERHYCLRCIVESQEKNPEEDFEKANICFLSNGTATGNHKNHLRQRHSIIEDTPKTAKTSPSPSPMTPTGKVRKRTSKVMTISVDSLVPVQEPMDSN